MEDLSSSTVQKPPLFKMPRVHKQAYWAFIDLVAPSDQLPEGKEQWSSSDAVLAYCHECKVTFEYKSGTSAAIRKHLSKVHPNVIAKTQGTMALCEATKLVNEALASKRKSGASFLSPSKRGKTLKPAEEEMATQLLTDWIGKCLRPLGITEDKELRFFITFIQTTSGIYELPSRRTITERLQLYAQQKRSHVKDEIIASALFFCLTSDIWTSRTTESFLALTIHFVTAAFDLKSFTLEVMSFPGKHTGVRIAALISSLMDQWGLDASHLTKVVGDNGSNIVKACKEMNVDHFGCIAHSLHLVVSGALVKSRDEVSASINGADVDGVAVNDVAEPEENEDQWEEDPRAELQAIDDIECEMENTILTGCPPNESNIESVDLETDDSLDEGLLDGCLSTQAAARILKVMKVAMADTRSHVARFRKIVTYFNKSAKGKAKLKALQDVAVPLTVIADVATHWNSTHEMLRRLLVLRPALRRFMAYIQTWTGKEEFSDVKIARPTGEMWFHAECLERLLVSFDGMTKLLSGETYTTLPLVLPCLKLLEKKLANKHIFARVSSAYTGEPYYEDTLKRMHLVRRLFLLLLRKRFKNLPLDVSSCSLLDPQFAHGRFLSEVGREASEHFLVNEAMQLAGGSASDDDLNSSFEEHSDDDDDFASELLGLRQRSSEADIREEQPLREKVKAELKLYFEKCKLREKTRKQNKTRGK